MRDQVAKFDRKEARKQKAHAKASAEQNTKGRGKNKHADDQVKGGKTAGKGKKGKKTEKGSTGDDERNLKTGKGKRKIEEAGEDDGSKKKKGRIEEGCKASKKGKGKAAQDGPGAKKSKGKGNKTVEDDQSKRKVRNSSPKRDGSPASNGYLTPEKSKPSKPRGWKVSPMAVKKNSVAKAHKALNELHECHFSTAPDFNFPPDGFADSQKVKLSCK